MKLNWHQCVLSSTFEDGLLGECPCGLWGYIAYVLNAGQDILELGNLVTHLCLDELTTKRCLRVAHRM